MRQGEQYMSGDKYTVWCGLLYSKSSFRQLALLPLVTVHFVPHCYCTICHPMKGGTWHAFERCVAPLMRWHQALRSKTCTQNEANCTSAPIWSRRSHRRRDGKHDVLSVGIILFTCWNTAWSITLSKKGRWWVAEVITQQVINKNPWTQTQHISCAHFLCSLAKW